MHTLFLIERCTNVENLSIHEAHWPPNELAGVTSKFTIRQVQSRLKLVPKLSTFEANCDWEVHDVSTLAKVVPRLRHLLMSSYTMDYLGSFPNLTKLMGARFREIRIWEVMGNRRERIMTDALSIPPMLLELVEERESQYARVAFLNIPSLELLWTGGSAVARRIKTDDETLRLEWRRGRRGSILKKRGERNVDDRYVLLYRL